RQLYSARSDTQHRDRYDELISIGLRSSRDVRAQLRCKCGDDPHSQSLAGTEIKISRQSAAVVAHRYERGVCTLSHQADVDMPALGVLKGILRGVCDEFIHDQSQRNSTIGIEPNSRCAVEAKLAIRADGYRVRTHRLQVCAQINVLDVCII